MLLPEIRAAAEATWSVPVVNSWVASESHGAFACHVGPGFHIGEDINVIELVDDDRKAVTAGVRSAKILLTNFSNRLMPLIRYEMSDQFQLETSGCGCGSAYQKVYVGALSGLRFVTLTSVPKGSFSERNIGRS